MEERIQRYKDYQYFLDESYLFYLYINCEPDGRRIRDLYSFYSRPGGRYGGIDKTQLDIFFGNRPIDSIKVARNFRIGRNLKVASGATLSYQRTDDGQVYCLIAPAKTKSIRHPEDLIILDVVKNPRDLLGKSKYHWEKFFAYMECTCIDGRPTFKQRYVTYCLRNFHEYVLNGISQKSKFNVLVKQIGKYVATVLLSGGLLYVIDNFNNSLETEQLKLERQELLKAINSIDITTKSIEEEISKNSIPVSTDTQ
ncbi:hypothetical protein QMT37_000889 [Vibrio fluvialis]|nr:hypothetical protein [Vibrio fluvialis]EKO3553423.1 hypothetical protein [Vibrio fluvialis]ELI1810399.1 hypothetical protein [Vibrio fluvialis]ELW1729114.1 hypothetical protein [Vibrio fluvialis]